MSVGGTSRQAGLRAFNPRGASSQPHYLAITGLPGGTRSKWAKTLAAEREGQSPWAHADLWRDLRELAAGIAATPWEQAPGEGTATTLGEQDIAALAAAASAGEAVRSRHPNVSSVVLARVADRLVAGHPGLRVLVFYQSPWEAFEEACVLHRLRGAEDSLSWLSYWLRYHEDVLAARQRAPDSIMLVNAARLGERAPILLELLKDDGIAVPRADLPALSRQRGGTGRTDLLASYMAERGGDFWDMYEALESSAQLLGRAPEFRDGHAGWEQRDLAPVVDLWSHALAAREVQLENELLQKQLQHVQDELSKYSHANEAMRDALGRSTEVADQARHLISDILGESGNE